MHGFNRLGGNSVAETVVAGHDRRRIHRRLLRPAPDNDVDVPIGLVREFLQREQAQLNALLAGSGSEDAIGADGAHAGDHDRRRSASSARGDRPAGRRGRAAAAAAAQPQHRPALAASAGANPELVTAYRVQKMLKLALCVAYGALARTESRGAHFREDYPAPRRRRLAQAHAGTLARRGRHAADPELRGAGRDGAWSCRRAGAATAPRTTSTTRTRRTRQAEVEALRERLARRRPLRGAAGADALRAPAAAARCAAATSASTRGLHDDRGPS
ncbi:MAG: hypothetical protein MZW92_80105 [Comamonadaceae bacterium]|nr:hypothetical protein [Comamonadaceae bacterium]